MVNGGGRLIQKDVVSHVAGSQTEQVFGDDGGWGEKRRGREEKKAGWRERETISEQHGCGKHLEIALLK